MTEVNRRSRGRAVSSPTLRFTEDVERHREDVPINRTRYMGILHEQVHGKENIVKQALVIDANDIKEILAEKYGVQTKNVIKSQYSYTVVLEDKEGDADEQ